MKLIRFATADSARPCFGIVIRDQAVPFAALQSKAEKTFPCLADSRSYLVNLPESEQAAKDMSAWGEQHLGQAFAKALLAPKPKAAAGQPVSPIAPVATMTTSSTPAPRFRSRLTGSEPSAAGLPNRRASCCRAAGRCANRCRNIIGKALNTPSESEQRYETENHREP